MTLSLAAIWRIARRDLSARIRGLRLLAVCLFLGVATLAAIGSLTAGIADELSRRGQTILGGDIAIEISQREASDVEKAEMRKLGALSETVRLRAMAAAPKIIFADEPTGNLDGATGGSIIDLLFERRAALGATLLIITHDPELARQCDRVIAMQDGLVVESVA